LIEPPLRTLFSALPEELRRRALTHASWTEQRVRSYERLEFLGDGVLGLAVAEELCRLHPDADEGRLAKLRAHIVSRRSCAVVARMLDLGADLERERIAGGFEAAGLETNRNVLAALCEAAIGAVFTEHGYAATAAAVVDAFAGRIAYAEQGFVDHKTELQEELARQGSSVSYRLVQSSGPPHRRRFESEAVVGDTVLGSGSGSSKKASEQLAARDALTRLRRNAGGS
jgi:ribonuclease-3